LENPLFYAPDLPLFFIPWFLGGNGNVAKIEAAMNISHSLGQKKDNKEQVTNFIWILIN